MWPFERKADETREPPPPKWRTELRIWLSSGKFLSWTATADTEDEPKTAWDDFLKWWHEGAGYSYTVKHVDGEACFCRHAVVAFEISNQQR